MLSRADQVRAYRFTAERMAAAAVNGAPDGPDSVTRTPRLALIAGVMVGVIMLAGVGIASLLGGPSPNWRRGDVVIVDRETASRYVYVDGVLYPVLNYTSARLIVGDPQPRLLRVDHAELIGHPRGLPVGIPGAPDTLPTAGSAIGTPWTVCHGSLNGAPTTWAVLGRPLAGPPTPGNATVLVESNDRRYLIWNGRRLLVPDGDQALIALNWTGVRRLPLPARVLNTIPPGPDLAVSIPGAGETVTLGGRSYTVGQLFVVTITDGSRQYYVVVRDGFARVGATAAALLGQAGAVTPITADALASIGASRTVLPAGYPDAVPAPADPDPSRAHLCARFDGSGDPTVAGYDSPPAEAAEARSAPPGDGGAVDRVLLAATDGGLVTAASTAGGSATSPVQLVDDSGRRYPLTDSARQSLGLGAIDPVVLPAPLIELLPRGPTLDPDAARRTSAVTTAPSPARSTS